MYSTEPMGSLVTLGGHLRVVLHSHDDATVAAESTDPPSSLANASTTLLYIPFRKSYGGEPGLGEGGERGWSEAGSKNGVDGSGNCNFNRKFSINRKRRYKYVEE